MIPIEEPEISGSVSSVIIDGGAKKYNQMVKIWKSNKNKDDRYQAVDEWMHKESKSKRIRFIENYMYALQPIRFDWAWKDEKDETFTTFRRYHKNDKIKDPQIRKAYEKWLADKETKKSKPKKKTTKRKAPAKKKTTKKRKSPAKKKAVKKMARKKTATKKKTIYRGKRKSPSTSATSVNVGKTMRGGDGKMYVCKSYKRGNKRVKRWVKA